MIISKEFLIIILLLSNTVNCDECSEASIDECLDTSNFCYIVEANVLYYNQTNTDGIILDEINDLCMSLNFYTLCDQLTTKQSCQLGSCIWDPIYMQCFEWDSATCQSYQMGICQWNPICNLVNQTLTLDLSTDYTLMNSVDVVQSNGRSVGTWLYEYGQIIQVITKESTQETYLFTKCQTKSLCSLIDIYDVNQAIFICHSSDLNCYYDEYENECSQISHLTDCSNIKWQSKCLSGAAPCMWLNSQCIQYDDTKVSCYWLSQDTCLNNEGCYLEGQVCKPYVSCSHFTTKFNCDTNNIFNCYYDDYAQQCKIITLNVQCKKIGQLHCETLSNCFWDKSEQQCTQILQDYYCQQYTQDECDEDSNDSDNEKVSCHWDSNTQLCVWEYTVDCTQRTQSTCDSGTDTSTSQLCYFDIALNQCLNIQDSTKCESLGNYACLANSSDKFCQWSSTRNLCVSIFDVDCTNLASTFCQYREKCYADGNYCNTRKQCSDNEQISDCQDDSTLYCYYDYSNLQCRRVTQYTECSSIFRQRTCNQAICAWKNGACLELEDVSCGDLTYQNCLFSDVCQYQNSKCIPIDGCGLNDNNYDSCILDTNHCIYNEDTNRCIQIDGATDCIDVLGADNCNYAACVLEPDTNKKLQCLEYENADCSYLKQDYCHFGQCTWNSTSKSCQSNPIKTSTVIIDQNTTNSTNTPNTTTSTFAVRIFTISIILIIFN